MKETNAYRILFWKPDERLILQNKKDIQIIKKIHSRYLILHETDLRIVEYTECLWCYISQLNEWLLFQIQKTQV